MKPRIVIIGAGAVGGYFGGYLTHRGHDVTLVDGWADHVLAMQRDGLKITGMTPEESLATEVRAVHLNDVQAFAMHPPIDIAIIATKAYDTGWATQMIAPYLAADGYVASLQNGVNEERIAEVVGWGRTIGCIAAHFASELTAPGCIKRNYPRGTERTIVYRVGEVHGLASRRVEAFAELAADVDTARVTNNLWGERWSKLCVNGMRNGLSAVTGLSGNDMNRNPISRHFGIRLGGQAVRIGQALGYQLEPIYRLDPETLARAAEGCSVALEDVETSLLKSANSASHSEEQRPSMAQDIRKGRRTEIDFLNGRIISEGHRLGLETSAHKPLVELVHRLERREIAPSLNHIADL